MVDLRTGDVGVEKINKIIVKDTSTQFFGKSLKGKSFSFFINDAQFVLESSDDWDSQDEILEGFYSGVEFKVIYYQSTDISIKSKMKIWYITNLNSFQFQVL